jgi:hypothetical protein
MKTSILFENFVKTDFDQETWVVCSSIHKTRTFRDFCLPVFRRKVLSQETYKISQYLCGRRLSKMKLFRKEKCFGNQFGKVSQLEIFKLIIYRRNIHRKNRVFLKKYRKFWKTQNWWDSYRVPIIKIDFPIAETSVLIETWPSSRNQRLSACPDFAKLSKIDPTDLYSQHFCRRRRPHSR